jgi:hypothetical protein
VNFWRGFGIYAAISIAPPLALALLSVSVGAIAMLFAYVVAPALVYAYPPLMLAPWVGGSATLLALIVAVLCCAAFGYWARHRNTGVQWILALVVFAGWWGVWRLIAFVADLHPDLGARM